MLAPAYRQASVMAFTTRSASSDRAIEVAHSNVEAAFTEFLQIAAP